MGNAAFYFYPAGTSAGLETIDLGEGVTDLQVVPIRVANTAYTMNGRMYRTVETARLQITIVNERFSSGRKARALESMSSHLELGGAVAFTADTDKLWAGFSKTAPSHGDTSIATHGNTFSALSAGTIASNDILAIQSPNPMHYLEYVRVNTATSYDFTLHTSVKYDHPEAQTLIRWRDFYPVLRLPENRLSQAFVTHDHRLTFTLDLVMVDDLPSIYDYQSPIDGATILTGESTLDKLLGPQSGTNTSFPNGFEAGSAVFSSASLPTANRGL